MTVGVCNGCSKRRQLTKEHLISLPIGQVIVGQRDTNTDAMRRLLPMNNVQMFIGERLQEPPEADKRLDMYVKNLLCGECNGGWAIQLEETVGPILYGFVHLRDRLSAIRELKRWMVFFAVKAELYYKRTEVLADGGPLFPVLGKLVDPDVAVGFELYVGVFDASPKRWQFGFAADPGLGQWPVLLWVHFWGVLFVLVVPGIAFTVPLSRATEGLRKLDVSKVRKRDLPKVMPPVVLDYPDASRPEV